MVFYRDLEANQWVVPNSGYHMKIKSTDRLTTFLDGGKYETVPLPSVPQRSAEVPRHRSATPTASRKAAPRPAWTTP